MKNSAMNSCAIIKFKLFDYEFDDFDRFYQNVVRISSITDAFRIDKKVDAFGVVIKVYSDDEDSFLSVFNRNNINRLKRIARKTFTFPPSIIIDKKHAPRRISYFEQEFKVA